MYSVAMHLVSPSNSLQHYRSALDTGRLSSRALIDDALAAAQDPAGEGARVFIRIFDEAARAAAEAADYLPVTSHLPLRGLPISVKDLFNIEGHVTRAGSVVLNGATPAQRDSPVIARLKNAGAVLIGRTNMTEFAFSGLGLNPHYGTPRSPWARDEARIPGGSSSGAAVSVSDGMAVAAIGSDTAGSVRIPAALCGLTGFKPTARRVPTQGTIPLSTTLDSIGPIAPTVACCAMLDEVLSGEKHSLTPLPLKGLRFGVLQGFVLDDLEPAVAQRFEAALRTLRDAGAVVTEISCKAIRDIPQLNSKGGFSAFESYAWHKNLIEQSAERYDPRVLFRIVRGREITSEEYASLHRERLRLISAAQETFDHVDAWLLPTVPRIAPRIAELERSDEAYFDANAAMLRNTMIVNFLDGCAITLPCHLPGEAPIGMMLANASGGDSGLLSIAHAVEEALANAGCAVQGREGIPGCAPPA